MPAAAGRPPGRAGAIAHAQFETIHPFSDGNGRAGRALVHAMVRAKGLVTSTTAPISAGLLLNTSGYTDALGAYRGGDARPIIERFSEASRFAAHSGAALVDQLADQMDEGHQALARTRLRPQAVAWRVLPHLIAQPVINARYLQERFRMGPPTAQRALAQLSDAGVLTERTGLKRVRVWQHSGILTVLDAYAAICDGANQGPALEPSLAAAQPRWRQSPGPRRIPP